MRNQSEKPPRWTAGQIVVGKPLTFLALTALLTVGLIMAFDPMATKAANQLGIQRGSQEETVFVLSCIGVFFIVSVIVSITLLKLISNAILARMDPAEAASRHAKAARPRWNIVYSIILGYILLLVFCTIAQRIFDQMNEIPSSMEASDLTRMLLLLLLCGFLPYVLAVLCIIGINKGMVRLTRTNQELIEEIRARQHDSKIPEQFRNETDIEGIIATLNGAQASTVRGAAAVYWVKCTLGTLFQAMGKAGVVLAKATFVLSIGTVAAVEFMSARSNDGHFRMKTNALFAATGAAIVDKAAAQETNRKRAAVHAAQNAPQQPAQPVVRSSGGNSERSRRAQAARERARQANQDQE